MRGLASFTRSTALSNGMDAQRSAGVLLSSPAAAQRCAEGAGLDSGAPAEAQSAMPSIALPCSAPTAHGYPPTPAAPMAPQLQPRISTSLTDVTTASPTGRAILRVFARTACAREASAAGDRSLCRSERGSGASGALLQ